MKIKKHPHIITICVFTLLLCITVLSTVLSFDLLVDNAALSTENARLQRQLDEKQVLLDSAVIQEAAIREAADQAIKQNKELVAENKELRAALTIYEPECVILPPTPPRYFDVPLDHELQDYIWGLCCAYDIEEHYELVYAMIEQESNFVVNAVSYTNDYGLMQINISNHRWLSADLGITDFLDPYQNVHAGIYIISALLHKYDRGPALMAYNLGEGGAAEMWRRGVYSTTYSEQVLARYNKFIENI